jgi:hypothetical protein
MRLYAKLVLAIALFAMAAQAPSREMAAELAFGVRAAYVMRFGTAAEVETLLDDTQRALAAERGGLDAYYCGTEYRRLLAERLAAAERVSGPLTEDEAERIRDACAEQAFGRWRPREDYFVAVAVERCPSP